jgi:hypothetical protein
VNPPDAPAIRIVRGDPDPYEVAALTVVLAAALAAPEPAARPAAARSRWAAARIPVPACSWAARPHPAWRPPF